MEEWNVIQVLLYWGGAIGSAAVLTGAALYGMITLAKRFTSKSSSWENYLDNELDRREMFKDVEVDLQAEIQVLRIAVQKLERKVFGNTEEK